MKERFPAEVCAVLMTGLFLIGSLNAQTALDKPAIPSQSVTESSIMAESSQKVETTFSSRSELVLVPVLVADRAGKHVAGLKKEDFTIKEDGKIQPVRFLEEISTIPSSAAQPKPRAPGTYSNKVEEQRPLRITIILFDMLNSHFKDQVPARKQLVKFLSDGVEPGTMVALMGLGRGGLRMYHDLTTDTKGLAAALETAATHGRHAIGNLNIGEPDEDNESTSAQSFVGHGKFAPTGSSGRKSRRFIILNTLEAFRNIAGAYAGVPGRKSLIWVTTGFPFTIDGYKTGSMPGLDQDSLLDVLPEYERTWQDLNNANVALYPVDMHGLLNTSSPDATYSMRRGGNPTQQLGSFAKVRQDKNADNLNTLSTFAGMTGGKAFYNSNDLVAGFRQAAADSASSYLLGYYLPKDAKPGWHSIHVNLARPGVQVRARSGFFIARHDPAKDEKSAKDLDVQLAMSSPINFTGVPVTVKWLGTLSDPKTAADAKKTVGFQVILPPHTVTIDSATNNSVSVNFIALARAHDEDDAGDFVKKIEGQLKPDMAARIVEAGLKFDSTIQLLPGKYNVRFVVRDNLSGKVGSVTAPLTVR